MAHHSAHADPDNYPFLAGGGEMGELTRSFDWSQSAVGAISHWPQSLRTTVSIILHSKFPMFLFWGPEHTCFYNDAYRPSLGNTGKHPGALGQKGEECWPEIWPFIGPQIEQVLAGGDATWFEDQFLPIYRNGQMEDVYWTFSYSPAYEESGAVGGVFVTCTETTGKVRAAEQQKVSDERFHNLVREASAGIVVLIGENMKVEIVNEAYGKLIDTKPEQLLGKPLFDVIPDAKETFYPFLLNVLKTGEPAHLYDAPYMVRVDGNEINGYLNVAYQPYKEIDGTITGVMAFIQDVTESVEAKKKLEQRENEMRFAMEAGSLGSWEFIPSTRIFRANDKLKNWFGHDPATEMSSEFALSVVVLDDRERVYNAIQRSMDHTSGGGYDIEYTIRNMIDGQERIVRAIGKTAFDNDNRPLRFSGTVQDITEQVRARNKLTESERELRFAIDASELGTFDLNPNTDTFKGNDRLKEWFGLMPYEEIELSLALSVIDARDRPRVVAAIEHALSDSSGGGYDIEYAIVHPVTGTERIVRAKGQASFNENKVPYRFNGTLQDITERVLSDRAIKEQKDYLENALAIADLGTFKIDMTTDTGQANATLQRIFDMDGGTGPMNSFFSRLHPEDSAMVREKMMDTFLSPDRSRHDINYRIVQKNGAIRYIHSVGVSTLTEDGRPGTMSGIIQDVTDQIVAQQLVADSEQNLRNIIAQSPVGMVLFRGRDLIVDVANAKILEHWGRTMEESQGRPLLEILPEIREQGFEQLLMNVYKTGESYKASEVPIMLVRSGQDEMRYVTFTFEAYREPDGTITGVMAIANDVTSEVIAQRQVEESELFASRIIDNSVMAQCIWTGYDMVYTMVNEKMLEIHDRDRSIIGMKYMDAIPELRDTPLMDRLRHVLTTGETYHQPEEQFTLRRRDGSTHTGYYSYTYQVLTNTYGENYAVLCTCMEVTDQVTARKKIAESEALFRDVVLQAPVGTCLFVGRDMKVEIANDLMLGYWGKDKSVLGLPLREAVPELEGQPFLAILDQVYTTGIAHSGEATPVVLANKGVIGTYYFTFTYQPVFNTAGEVYAIIDSAADVTEQTLARQRIDEAQAEVRKTAESLQLALEAGRMGTFDVVIATNEVIANTQCRVLFGMPAEGRLDNSAMMSAVHPDDIAMLEANKKHAIETGEDYNAEHRVIMPDGAVRWIRAAGKLIYDTDDHLTNIVGITVDITAQRVYAQEMEEARVKLAKSAESLELALGAGRLGTYDMDIASGLMICNPQCKANFGLDEDTQMTFELVLSMILPEDRPVMLASVNHAIASGEDYNAEYRTRWADGSPHWIRASGKVIYDEGGAAKQIVGITVDITAQKLYAQEMEENEKRFRLLAESLPQLVWMTDNSGKYAFASKKWQEYSGIDPLAEGAWESVLHPSDTEQVSTNFSTSIKTGQTYRVEVRLRSKTGEYRWHYGQGEPIYDENGTIVSWIGAFTDIHEQKTISQKLEALVADRTRELQRSNDDLMQFAHVTSHDLKEPVRKIKLFTTRLEDEYGATLPGKGQEFIGKIQHGTDRMLAMIEGILTYSSLTAADQPIEEVDLDTVIGHIESDLEVPIAHRQATISRHALPAIEGAPVLISQLFYNIIQNALKFAREEQPLRIDISSQLIVKKDIRYAEITIADNGIGFEDTYGKKIFDTFTRLNSKDQYEGTGLGLALCKKIVERHHGRISATGKPDEGATFTIWLPLHQDSAII